MWTAGLFDFMKSQDILLLFKMASLHAQEEKLFEKMESKSMADLFEPPREPSVSPSMVADDPVGCALAAHNPDPEDTVYRVQELDTPMADADRWEGWSDAVPSPPVSSWNESYSLRALSASLGLSKSCLLYTSPSPRDGLLSRMPSSA